MITREQIGMLQGLDVFDPNGDRIGAVGQVWTNAAGQPAWVSVRTGFFGMNESLAPLSNADLSGGHLMVAYSKGTVKDAPNIDAAADEPLTEAEVATLYRYYGINWDDSYLSQPGPTEAGMAGEASEPAAQTDDAMTRSEEHLNVDTERQAVGKARLRKYVVTEQQQVTVPVSHDEVRIEREPITDANRDAAYSGPDISEAEEEVTLYAERPVVTTEAVPVERVRMTKETATEKETVSGEVRKEVIDVELADEDKQDGT
jgi:uncharacterized protein (TIGR02271 family)